MSASLAALQRPRIENPNAIVKSGHLLISSKGLGWKSWKKRWFILTRTSLVFFKNDPNVLPRRGGEVNSTLGGIDISNSGSVVVREDKKLLTVLFPDGRAFTLKAETSEDLYEWKTALERTLAEAPNVALVMRKNGIFPSDTADSFEGSFRQLKGNCAVKSVVLGCPILLSLEDIDGGPSFLEKALQFLEKHGTKVEGILRQSADVEEVDWRIQEYEQGKTEFGPDEDAHVIGDCVKYVLRELPSSPVPASCCSALLEAYRIDRKDPRINVMRSIIRETFPEPNRCLLQRVLKVMHTISSHSSTNLMNPPAVAACMAPLLLRSLVAGECELDDDSYVNGDNSAQLLAAANAASNARAIITTLLEEYENIFNDDSLHRCSISVGSQIENGSEDTTDNENHDMKQNCYPDADHEVEPKTHDDPDRTLSGNLTESSDSEASDIYDYKVRRGPSMESVSASGEEELSVRRLELAKDDLRQRIAKEERGNAILQARLERKRQALHARRLALEQEVVTLQEQLQAERDLWAALEVGLSMSTGQFPGSRGMDSETRTELEDIALAEADVTSLKQKVAELHLQLNRQRLLHYGSLTNVFHQYQHAADHSLQEKYFRQTFDAKLDSHNPGRKNGTEVLDHVGRPSSASSTLVELTTRLDFFKERRSQLMEQLNNLDLNYGAISQPSPAWN